MISKMTLFSLLTLYCGILAGSMPASLVEANEQVFTVGLSVWTGYPSNVRGFKQAMTKGGFIEGRNIKYLYGKNDIYEFSVSDDGVGIEPEFHERVFTLFQTLKPRDEVEGSGMGLAFVKKEVELHGGTVQIRSEAGTRGTTFHFTWKGNSALLATGAET